GPNKGQQRVGDVTQLDPVTNKPVATLVQQQNSLHQLLYVDDGLGGAGSVAGAITTRNTGHPFKLPVIPTTSTALTKGGFGDAVSRAGRDTLNVFNDGDGTNVTMSLTGTTLDIDSATGHGMP